MYTYIYIYISIYCCIANLCYNVLVNSYQIIYLLCSVYQIGMYTAIDNINVRQHTSIGVLSQQFVMVIENQSAMEELRSCSLTPTIFTIQQQSFSCRLRRDSVSHHQDRRQSWTHTRRWRPRRSATIRAGKHTLYIKYNVYLPSRLFEETRIIVPMLHIFGGRQSTKSCLNYPAECTSL